MKNEHEITINKIELASELASAKLVKLHDMEMQIFEDSDDGETMVYTEDAQDIFNGYYDEYLTLIESCKA